jgi:hypothetical protein
MFTIVNHENRTTRYSYIVTSRSPYGRREITRGTVMVESGRAAVERVEFIPTRPATAYVITVHLRGRPETIHFSGVSSA